MKLLDDKKTKDANSMADTEMNGSTSFNETKIVKFPMGEVKDGKKILCNGLIQNRKICYDDLSRNGIKDGDREDEDGINVNINKEQKKLMRQLTQELALLRVKEVDKCGNKPELLSKSDLFGGEKKSNEISVDSIIAGMKEMVLKKELRENQTDDDFAVTGEKVENPEAEEDFANGKEGEGTPELADEENKTVVIVAQPEKKGEENEDCAATVLLSDVDSQTNYVSLEFVGRGPLFGFPKGNDDDEESDTYTQPKKFSKPMTYYPHMSGGYVHEAPSNNQPPFYDPDNYVNRCNYPPMSHPHEKFSQPGFMPSAIPTSGHPYDFNPDFSHLDWYLNSQPLKYYDPCSEYIPSLGNVVGDFDGFPLSQNLAHHGFAGFPEPCSPNDLYINSQLPIRSPHDQVLSSPESSPPSFANSPYNPASIFSADCDAAAMSPSSYSTLSPESGIVTDLAEATLDLELALEYVEEHACDGDAAKKTPFLPELIETLNTVINPIDGTVLPSCCTMCHEVTSGVNKTNLKDQKRQTLKAQRKQTTQALSPVAVADNVQPGIAFPPPGINVNLLPQNFSIPCVFIEPVKGSKQPVHARQRRIQPKPPPENFVSSTTVSKTSLSNVHANTLPAFIPPLSPESPSQMPIVMSSSEQDQLVKAYRWVAGLQKEKLLLQDDDGDTILHLTIVKDEKKLVKALLERYVREDLIDKVINLANRQHQTPLCLAVFLNQMDIVKMLIERGADVNVQLQRKLNCGLMCYRLIHYAAKRGQKWVQTLKQLLGAKNIDLHAFDSDGCTAMHCAIKDHGEIRHGSEKINSKDTIFYLAMHGADLNCQHGLSGKTPLHYAIEKKDSDLVGWFLGLAMHVQSPGARVSSNGTTDNLLSSIINARPSGGITAVQLALNIQMDPEERIKILELLLTNGAEVSQKGCDGKLRQELGKYPKLALLLKNGTSALKNV